MWFDLHGDKRLGRCATEDCGGQPAYRLEVDGTGSDYCSGCRAKIVRLKRRLAEAKSRAGTDEQREITRMNELGWFISDDSWSCFT